MLAKICLFTHPHTHVRTHTHTHTHLYIYIYIYIYIYKVNENIKLIKKRKQEKGVKWSEISGENFEKIYSNIKNEMK